MNEEKLQSELFLLTGYMLTSAAGLVNEPDEYAVFRLLDSSGRLLDIMEENGLLTPFLSELKTGIDEQRYGSMDNEELNAFLNEAVIQIAEETHKRLSRSQTNHMD